MKIKDEQQAALAAGLKRFHSDTKCRKCGGQLRITSTMGCAECQSYATRKMRSEDIAKIDINFDKVKSLSDLLVVTRGNQTSAAIILGVNRATLRNHIVNKTPNAIIGIGGKAHLLVDASKHS